MHIGELAAKIEKDGWQGKSIKAVKKGDKLVVLDHRRTVAVAITQSSEVEANFAVYGSEDEFSSDSCERQYGTRKAGEAVKKRMRRGSLSDSKGIGFPSSDVRIRTTKLSDNPDTKLTDATLEKLEKLEEMNFQVGGQSRKTRSRSLDRFSSTQKGSSKHRS